MVSFKYAFFALALSPISFQVFSKEAPSKEVPLDKIIVIQNNNSTLTLQDIAKSLNITPHDFKTDYKMPSKEEYKVAPANTRAIIEWYNPQTIKNINPPVNRPNQE